MAIHRYSSRSQRLDESFLTQNLVGAQAYKRIAGYFTSSLFEVAGEAIAAIPDVKIVCNVDIHPDDLKVAQVREAKLLGRWNEHALEAEALLHRDRYRRLDEFLQKHGSSAIRVAPDDVCGFVHGKAGVITLADGSKVGFIGSMNETYSGWRSHYEILWEDDSPEAVAWIEDEFEHLWNAARPLPQVVMREIHRRGYRREVEFAEIDEDDHIAPAALIESPLYREGQQLQPWQQGFLTECLRHYNLHRFVRLLLADEVGLGKTLSLATAALTLCLLEEKNGKSQRPVVIFAPATLTAQWQTELIDKLGIPTARWDTNTKVWLDVEDRPLSPVGREYIARCPLRIGIISTGLMMRESVEKQQLLELSYDVIILDEAHKARRRRGPGLGDEPNNLLAFMLRIADRSRHVLLGTATPIQTDPADLWDLLEVLQVGDGRFVLGNQWTKWHDPEGVISIISGTKPVATVDEAWDLLRSPLPLAESTGEPHAQNLYRMIRSDLGLRGREWETSRPIVDLDGMTREVLDSEIGRTIDGARLFQRENPIVRHVVLRKRRVLEQTLGPDGKPLLKPIGVNVHPNRDRVSEPHLMNALFAGKALRTPGDFREAYDEAREFGKALAKRGKGSGFMKNLMEQRICSSIAAGIATADRLLNRKGVEDENEESDTFDDEVTSEEAEVLERLIARLRRLTDDPKLAAVKQYLSAEGWLEHGVIIFSQYYDTARWLADALAADYPDTPIGLYAGAGKSLLYQGGQHVQADRETLKRMVSDHQIRLMVATDAACEGLNLQTLGTLINVDLPWNPTRLEQRIGRIKRFGQARKNVDMLNLVFQDTVDEKIYDRLSDRMQDRYDLFGSLPDTIEDDWIDNIEALDEKMDEYIEAQRRANGFDIRYDKSMQPPEKDWREFTDVLPQRDVTDLMSKPWR